MGDFVTNCSGLLSLNAELLSWFDSHSSSAVITLCILSYTSNNRKGRNQKKTVISMCPIDRLAAKCLNVYRAKLRSTMYVYMCRRTSVYDLIVSCPYVDILRLFELYD